MYRYMQILLKYRYYNTWYGNMIKKLRIKLKKLVLVHRDVLYTI
jgi:hypothetical protein